MTRDELKEYVVSHFDGLFTPTDTGRFDPMFEIKPESLLDAAKALKDDEALKFDFLANISGVDTGEHFEVVYSVASIGNRLRLDFKIVFPYDSAEIDSVQTVWAGANWHEREIWELYGINIRNHDSLTRFLLPDEWDQGHPMRKDWDSPDFIRMPEL